MDDEKNFVDIGHEIGLLLREKNASYGNSFEESEKVLKVLFPDGVPVEKYQDFLTITRIIDKLFRIATDKNAFSEDPWRDIAGYSILSIWSQQKTVQFEMRGTTTGRTSSKHPNQANGPHAGCCGMHAVQPRSGDKMRKRLNDELICVSDFECDSTDCEACEHVRKHPKEMIVLRDGSVRDADEVHSDIEMFGASYDWKAVLMGVLVQVDPDVRTGNEVKLDHAIANTIEMIQLHKQRRYDVENGHVFEFTKDEVEEVVRLRKEHAVMKEKLGEGE